MKKLLPRRIQKKVCIFVKDVRRKSNKLAQKCHLEGDGEGGKWGDEEVKEVKPINPYLASGWKERCY